MQLALESDKALGVSRGHNNMNLNNADAYRSMSSFEAQILGQQYYRKGDYKAALEAFSAVSITRLFGVSVV